MNNNLVSILIPCYNKETHLKQCIESALNQTYQNKEIILIDDGSTDNSLKIASAYPIKIISRENKGKVKTCEELLELSNGEWLQYLDADDYLFPTKIEQQLSLPAAEVYMDGYKLLYNDGKETINFFKDSDKNSILNQLVRGKGLQGNCMLINKNLLTILKNKNGYIWKNLPLVDLWLLLDFCKIDAHIITTNTISGVYRVNWSENQLTNQKKEYRKEIRGDIKKEALSYLILN